jgi:hypothetical protein
VFDCTQMIHSIRQGSGVFGHDLDLFSPVPRRTSRECNFSDVLGSYGEVTCAAEDCPTTECWAGRSSWVRCPHGRTEGDHGVCFNVAYPIAIAIAPTESARAYECTAEAIQAAAGLANVQISSIETAIPQLGDEGSGLVKFCADRGIQKDSCFAPTT